MDTVDERQLLLHRKGRSRLVCRQHKFLNHPFALAGRTRQDVLDAPVFDDKLRFVRGNVHRSAVKSAGTQNLRQLLHPFDLRNQLGIFFQNLWRCCLVQNGVNLRVNALDSGTDIAFYKAEAFDFSAGLEGNQRRKGQTDLIGIERADAVGKLLWQHRNHLVRIVDAGSSAVGFQIQRTALADIMADVCDVYAQIPVVLVALKRDCIVQILAVRRVDGEDVHTGQIHAVAQFGKRNTLLLNLSCLR